MGLPFDGSVVDNATNCPVDLMEGNLTYVNTIYSVEERAEIWQGRMREIQGAIAVASLFQV